jgi:hypothetical protein
MSSEEEFRRLEERRSQLLADFRQKCPQATQKHDLLEHTLRIITRGRCERCGLDGLTSGMTCPRCGNLIP